MGVDGTDAHTGAENGLSHNRKAPADRGSLIT
jgi:hypothetical protein